MPKPGKKRSAAQKRFMAKALERGYIPLTPAQVRYFGKVVHGKPGRHSASTPHHQHAEYGHAYSTSRSGSREHVRHVKKKASPARRRAR